MEDKKNDDGEEEEEDDDDDEVGLHFDADYLYVELISLSGNFYGITNEACSCNISLIDSSL